MSDEKFEYKTITSNGQRMYLAKGPKDANFKFHRYDGPAIEPIERRGGARKAYYLYGMEYGFEEYQELMRERKGVPFHKTALGKQTGART